LGIQSDKYERPGGQFDRPAAFAIVSDFASYCSASSSEFSIVAAGASTG
jgi:hypothetical protein